MTQHLPANVAQLRGRRAARWIRESTTGQFDRYGPDVQREQIEAAIARLGLVDTGLGWSPAHSGSTVHASPAMRAMVAAAKVGAFDVLVVARSDRWQRNLRETLNLLEGELHPAGVAIWFNDEELLSSSDRAWDQLVDEAKGADSWLRKHRRRVREGLAAKLATRRDPGGRPPFGFRRNAAKLVEPDPAVVPTVQRAFALALEGATDREIAATLRIPLYTLRGILTSPLMVGRLRDGGPANWSPIVDVTTWNQVGAIRSDRNRRSPGRPETRRTYALPMLVCAFCDRRLVGDKDRYRHLEACDRFLAAAPQPERSTRGQHRRIPGGSYGRAEYEDLVPFVLERVALRAVDVAETVAAHRRGAPAEPDRLGLARIDQERDRAMARYRRDRDAAALEATMARLDVEDRDARAVKHADVLGPDEVLEYLRSLPKWWADVDDDHRKLLAETLFEHIAVEGIRRATFRPTPEAVARGLAQAFGPYDVEMVGARGVATTISMESIAPERLRTARSA